MLYGPMLHPELLRVLGSAGHGATVLIADANYPHGVWVNPRAERVALNLAPRATQRHRCAYRRRSDDPDRGCHADGAGP